MSRILRSTLLGLAASAVIAALAGCGNDSNGINIPNSAVDQDGDGVLDDGNRDGVPNSLRCAGGDRTDCDDNCPTTDNPDQADPDNDSIGSACDNCPAVGNVDQVESDVPSNGLGDACDVQDTDGDGLEDPVDNCPTVPNGDQANPDGDMRGSVCDNCPAIANDDQLNTDGDATGDACDDDDDNDGVADAGDNAATNPRSCRDMDADGCDDCSQNPTSNATATTPAWPVYTPSTTNDSTDTDGDGTCDGGDGDDDNDGVGDVADNAPTNPRSCRDADVAGSDGCDDCSQNPTSTATPTTPAWPVFVPAPANDGADTDGDGACNVADPDDDNDSILDGADNAPANPQACRDADTDTCDDCSQNPTTSVSPTPWAAFTAAPLNDGADTDGDGICNAGDTCPNDAANDTDNDGLCDDVDPCDTNPNPAATDTNTDGDTISGCTDNCSAVANENQANADGDSAGDACDNCPNTNSTDFTDANNNGFGDICERIARFTYRATLAGQQLFTAGIKVADAVGDGYIRSCAACGPGVKDFDAQGRDFSCSSNLGTPTTDAAGFTLTISAEGPNEGATLFPATATDIDFAILDVVYRDMTTTPNCNDMVITFQEFADTTGTTYMPQLTCSTTLRGTAAPCSN